MQKRSSNQSTEKLKEKESQALLAEIKPNTKIITLDVTGKMLDTPQLAHKIQTIKDEAMHIAFLIGGPDGMSNICLEKADFVWSLSKLTLPHPMVRLILFEQLYRSWSIINHHPYHK